jgi:hypothetical protein
MDIRLNSFRSAYQDLAKRVRTSLQTRVGDVVLLRSQTDLAMRFLNAAEKVLSPSL